MVVLLTRHLKSTGGDQRRIKGVWISLLFPLFSADTPDVKRFAQVFLYQCSYGRASANIGGQNLLTSDVIYQLDGNKILGAQVTTYMIHCILRRKNY